MNLEKIPKQEERIGDKFYCQHCFHDSELHDFKRKWKKKSRCHGWKPGKTLEERCECHGFVRAKEKESGNDAL